MRLKSWTFTRLSWQLSWWVYQSIAAFTFVIYWKLKHGVILVFRRRKVIFKICWKLKLLHWLKQIVLFHNTGVGGLNRKPRYDDDFFGSIRLLSIVVVTLPVFSSKDAWYSRCWMLCQFGCYDLALVVWFGCSVPNWCSSCRPQKRKQNNRLNRFDLW